MAQYSAAEIYRYARQAGFAPDQAATMTAIALAESGGNGGAHNPNGEDSRGLWQINLDAHRSWAGEMDLYDPLENARAAYAVSQRGGSISPWTVTHGGADARYLRFRDEAEAAALANGDPPGLGRWTGSSGYGDPVPAGVGDGGGGGEPSESDDPGAVETFLDAALSQAGDPYVFGAEADGDDADPDVFDCSELTQWAAHRAGVELPDGSWLQYLELQEQGLVIPVEEAIDTPGALLFSFSSDPTPGGGRPSSAHVAISLGDGRTIEARGRRYGVGTFDASGRFQYAALVPGLSGRPGDPIDAAGDADVDLDGLLDRLERELDMEVRSRDFDGDGLTDGEEVHLYRTDPQLVDGDGDQVIDSVEIVSGTNPSAIDSDLDGRSDRLHSGATARDSDRDGLADELELLLGTDTSNPDSDGDGFLDGAEHGDGFSPVDPFSNILADLLGPAPDTASGGATTAVDAAFDGLGGAGDLDSDDVDLT